MAECKNCERLKASGVWVVTNGEIICEHCKEKIVLSFNPSSDPDGQQIRVKIAE